jgi:predicted acetyltransferase
MQVRQGVSARRRASAARLRFRFRVLTFFAPNTQDRGDLDGDLWPVNEPQRFPRVKAMTRAEERNIEGLEVRSVDSADVDTSMRVFETAWAFHIDEEERRRTGTDLASERSIGAYAGSDMVGTAMSFSMELTVPGLLQVPLAGVSYIAVHPLHRRRGIMTALMRHQLDELRNRGEALAALGASEATIYGRFGYGPATWDSTWRLPRGVGHHLPGTFAGSLELLDAPRAAELGPVVHDEARRIQVGDVRTYPGRWRDLIGHGPQSAKYFLLYREPDGHPTGFAIYRLERNERYSSHTTLLVDHLVASTATAYRNLWAYLVDVDLTDWVVASGRPEHEALQWALADPRQLVVSAIHDHLWLRLVDLPGALSARRYGTEGSLVLDVADPFCPWNEGLWFVSGSPDGAECRRAKPGSDADLTLGASELASLYLGGASVARLVEAGRVGADTRRRAMAQAMFAADPGPWCSTEF